MNKFLFAVFLAIFCLSVSGVSQNQEFETNQLFEANQDLEGLDSGDPPVNLVENFCFLSYCEIVAINHSTSQNSHVWERLDFNKDKKCDIVDLQALTLLPLATGIPAKGEYEKYDVTKDGVVNKADVHAWCQIKSEKASSESPIALGLSACFVAGDTNLDGVVDGGSPRGTLRQGIFQPMDLAIEIYVDDAPVKGSDKSIIDGNMFVDNRPMGWADGDFNCDRVVDVSDVNLFRSHYIGPVELFSRVDIDGDNDADEDDRSIAFASIHFQLGLADISGDGVENETDWWLFHQFFFRGLHPPISVCAPPLNFADVDLSGAVDSSDVMLCLENQKSPFAWLPFKGNVNGLSGAPESWNFDVDVHDLRFILDEIENPKTND